MDVGSAKVTKEEMDGIPHYLIDVLDPEEAFNVEMCIRDRGRDRHQHPEALCQRTHGTSGPDLHQIYHLRKRTDPEIAGT